MISATVRRLDRQVVIHSGDHLALSFDDFPELQRRMVHLVVLVHGELSDVYHRSVGHIWNRLPSAECCSAQRGGGFTEEEDYEDCDEEIGHFWSLIRVRKGCR
ncbi:hypothetical protein R6Q59_036051 [Mikania micrantha]